MVDFRPLPLTISLSSKSIHDPTSQVPLVPALNVVIHDSMLDWLFPFLLWLIPALWAFGLSSSSSLALLELLASDLPLSSSQPTCPELRESLPDQLVPRSSPRHPPAYHLLLSPYVPLK